MPTIIHMLKKYQTAVFLTLIFSAYLGFGLHHLGQFVTADEHYWLYERTPQYWDAIAQEKWKKTLINDKPGVSIALISGIGLLSFPDPAAHQIQTDDEDYTLFDAVLSEDFYIAFRLPVLLCNASLLLLAFWLLRKLTSDDRALWSVFFMALSPSLLGISQIINPDALLWSFSITATLALLVSLKTSGMRYAVLCGVLSGLALLTKYTANILAPFFVFLLLAYPLFMFQAGELSQKLSLYFKRGIISFLIIASAAAATLLLFLPAIFVKPIYLYRLTLGQPHMLLVMGILTALIASFAADAVFNRGRLATWFFRSIMALSLCLMKITSAILLFSFALLIIGRNFSAWTLFETVPFNLKYISYIDQAPQLWETVMLQLNPIVFSLPPMMLGLMLALWGFVFFNKKISSSEKLLITAANMFFIFYITAAILSDTLVTIRYGIMLYPFAAILAAIGASRLIRICSTAVPSQRSISIAVSGLIVAGYVMSLVSIRPYYFNYTSSLLPSDAVIADSWGYGGYEAAQYLNSLPDAEHLLIWSDYYGACEFFRGKCSTDYVLDPNKKIDYYVLSRRGRERYFEYHIKWEGKTGGIQAAPYYASDTPAAWSLTIDGRPSNTVRVIKSDR